MLGIIGYLNITSVATAHQAENRSAGRPTPAAQRVCVHSRINAMAWVPEIEMGVTVAFSDVFNKTPTIADAGRALAQYDRDSVLLVLAKLSTGLRLWSWPDYVKDNGVARDVFKNAASVLRQPLRGRPQRLFFTRLGVLATARLALISCDDTAGIRINQPVQAAQILACCLMMNELTASSEVLTGADLLVHQLSNDNAMAHVDFRADLLRSLALFERNQQLLGKKPGLVDLEREFTRATGLPPRLFVELCVVAGASYRSMNAGSLITDDPTFLIDKRRFATVAVDDDSLSAFFRLVAQNPQELAAFLPTQGIRPLADTTVFQTWPMIRVASEERYYCLDVASLLDKTGRGLYWTLFSSADAATKGRLGGTYGLAFEAYLHDRVRAARFGPDRYIDNPKFANGDEVCDAIFVDGSHLVFCEYKSSVLRADAKLSGRLDSLIHEIEKKFITGDNEGRKGIAQLAQSIRRFLIGEEIEGIPIRKWNIILPVMICLERSMLCPGMSGFLNSRFDRTTLKALASTRIGPLILIDVEHFETSLADINQYGFDTLLDDYYRTHMRKGLDQLVAFKRKNIPFLDDKPEPPDEKGAAFGRFFSEMGERLFGEAI
jgi:hypothetical protein